MTFISFISVCICAYWFHVCLDNSFSGCIWFNKNNFVGFVLTFDEVSLGSEANLKGVQIIFK